MKGTWIFALAAVGLVGCTGLHDAMTPDLRVEVDDFDGTTIVYQPAVGPAVFSDGTSAMIGFEWLQRRPDVVYLTAGVTGIESVNGLQMTADGENVNDIVRVSTLTDFHYPGLYLTEWSSARFAVPLAEFLKIVRAADVRMRVDLLDSYEVSMFGPNHPKAIVNMKLPPFLAKIADLRGGLD